MGEIFSFFDKDKDNFLNMNEMISFSQATEEPDVQITQGKWAQTCSVMGVDPSKGLTISDLTQVYHDDVNRDYGEVFGAQSLEIASNFSFAAKANRIFKQFDVDLDGYLSRKEMNAFTSATEGTQEELDEQEWLRVCHEMGLDPNQGVGLMDLISIYRQTLDDDYEVMVYISG